MRNLDIADSRAKLEQYADLGMLGSSNSTLIGAAQAASVGLIGAMPAGGAETIASAVRAAGGEMLDRAAMELGTD
ncbi:MAG: hypothetical protein ACRDQZ_08450 [Mycobacteriales bacterium]